ncbi:MULTISPECIES: hypothetical protein [Kitasatospora]|uniref:Uncharacterized protein n=1 Tax=Kitasatospora setae (strain ATCC 33774 / DSM 43861 / JCM 3304 / KCC A-0304 / NBRC 14216 / KM-6054) TaxID=452652 RepID=E4N165_KITSK|nr:MULTISPECIES: hypothetical protein [Kitasatospora]BAJ31899.1 hypothetical protein KSE_61330 [Kitasatospora setae KM-6054]
MPLTAADLVKLGDVPVAIQSAFFHNIFVRLDGTGVTSATDAGGGVVNAQYGLGPLTTFKVRAQADGSFAFESTAFGNVFLRLDGTGVPAGQAGGGKVNAQFGAGPYEKYRVLPQASGTASFESVAFPGTYLRLVTGSGVTAATGPGGTVNAQVNANGGENETFYFVVA